MRSSEKICAVILSAGEASRLRPYSEEKPKSLMELAPGASIIDFQLSQLQNAGVGKVFVVTRREHLAAFRQKLGGRAKLVPVDGQGSGNLHSLRCALDAVGPRQILLSMGDHIYEAEILRRLMKEGDGSKRILLCLDKEPESRDLREGLRVQASPQEVQRVGKTIPPHSGVDTGLFILPPTVHDSIRRLDSEKAGEATLSDLVNLLAAKGDVGYVVVTKRIWLDIDTPADLLEARRRYWKILRHSLYKETDGPISQWLNRPLSTRLSIFLFKHVPWATPNRITVLSFILALAAVPLFIQAQFILAALIVHLSSILDGVDGELARLRSQVTPFGGLLDSVLDRVADISLMIALGLSLAPGPIRVALTGLAVFGVVLVSYVSHLISQYVTTGDLRNSFPWATRDVRLFSVTLGGLIFQPLLPIIFSAIAPLLFVALSLLRLAPELRPPDMQKHSPLDRQRIPEPKISANTPPAKPPPVRRNIESLLLSSIKLALALGALQLIAILAEQIPAANSLLQPFNTVLLIDLGRLVLIAYYGYRILLSVKFFADIGSDLVVTKVQITQDMYARIVTNALYIAVLVLSWSLSSSVIARIPELSLFTFAINMVFLTMVLLLAYDISRTIRRGSWSVIVTRLSDWITVHLQAPSSHENTQEEQSSPLRDERQSDEKAPA